MQNQNSLMTDEASDTANPTNKRTKALALIATGVAALALVTALNVIIGENTGGGMLATMLLFVTAFLFLWVPISTKLRTKS